MTRAIIGTGGATNCTTVMTRSNSISKNPSSTPPKMKFKEAKKLFPTKTRKEIKMITNAINKKAQVHLMVQPMYCLGINFYTTHEVRLHGRSKKKSFMYLDDYEKIKHLIK